MLEQIANHLTFLSPNAAWAAAVFIYGVGIFLFVALNALVLVYIERKVSAFMQVRLGPMRVGPVGLLQTVADALKLVLKEDIIPDATDKLLFRIGPFLILFAAVITYAAVPFSPHLLAADMNIGLLYVISISALVVIGIVMSGWASNNKWSLYGAMRSAAQIVSYEIPAGLTLLAVVAVAGSLNLQDIIRAQGGTDGLFHWIPLPLPRWFVFHDPFLFLAAFIYIIAGTAEVNRTPFDIPEAESELVAGWMTEYSGIRWALFFMSEYANMTLVTIIASIAFLGGWQSPFPSGYGARWSLVVLALLTLLFSIWLRMKTGRISKYPFLVLAVSAVAAFLFPGFADWLAQPGLFWLAVKAAALIFLLMWFRWTFPRLRVDQLMFITWKVLLPLAFINLMGVALWLWATGELAL